MEVIQRKNTKCAVVSVICYTYNQKNYIRQALEGMMMQNTSFEYEIIVHDDASSDGTSEIIKEYAMNYPDKITVLFQEENQYSQKKSMAYFVEPYVTGKYVAFCEGDDFWISDTKLQQQVDAMEKYGECSMCVHAVQGISEDGEKKLRMYPSFSIKQGICKAEDVMRWMLANNQWVFQTSSFFLSSDMWREMRLNGPEYVKQSNYGDVSMMRYCAAHGDFYYIDEIMSCYRIGAVGSTWMQDKKNAYNIDFHERWLKALLLFDEETDGSFHQDILIAKEREEVMILCAKREYKTILHNKRLYKKLSSKKKVQVLISSYFPSFDKVYYGLRKIIRGY